MLLQVLELTSLQEEVPTPGLRPAVRSPCSLCSL
jgi:hypothetical protein